VLFANLIHITRQFFRSYLVDGDRYILYTLFIILREISRVDIQNTVPGLQKDFCALWNEIVLKARVTEASSMLVYLLKEIRHIYMALHQGTDSAPTAFSASTLVINRILSDPSSYPLCNIPGHASHTVTGPPEESAATFTHRLASRPRPNHHQPFRRP
jgi:hypothetical protein